MTSSEPVGAAEPLPKVWTYQVVLDCWITLIGCVCMTIGLVKAWGATASGVEWGSLWFGVFFGFTTTFFAWRAGTGVEEHLIERRIWLLRNSPEALRRTTI